ncbi:MAG: hypothetical protein NT011_09835 [Kiritimatiellaeota bacterium]|nr:hypothetical protein [Kiritimatiellota bacterium]
MTHLQERWQMEGAWVRADDRFTIESDGKLTRCSPGLLDGAVLRLDWTPATARSGLEIRVGHYMILLGGHGGHAASLIKAQALVDYGDMPPLRPGLPMAVRFRADNRKPSAEVSLDGRILLHGEPDLHGGGFWPGFPDEVVITVLGGATLQGIRLDSVPVQRPRSFPVPSARGQRTLAIAVDFGDDIGAGVPWTRAHFDAFGENLRRIGFRRVYWMYDGEPDGGVYDDGSVGPKTQHVIQTTYQHVGVPLDAAVRACHAHGLEVYALFKPFEMGLNLNTEERRGVAEGGYGKRQRIGGWLTMTARIFRDHPELLMMRRDAESTRPEKQPPVCKIRCVHRGVEPTRVHPDDVELWVSDDNTSYRRYQGPMERSEQVEEVQDLDIRDGLVVPVGTRTRRRTITFCGFTLRHPYYALKVPCGDDHGEFVNRLYALVELFGPGDERIPFTYGFFTGAEESPPGRDFSGRGFLFDDAHQGPWIYSGRSILRRYEALDHVRGATGIAVGKNAYTTGTPEPGCALARAEWLRWVERCLAMGVDGVDLRVPMHTRSFEWEAYGFNPPVAEAYRAAFGSDPRQGPFDAAQLHRLRGDQYTQFVREAAARCRAYGRPLQVHIDRPMDHGPRGYPFMGVDWQWRRWVESCGVGALTFKEIGGSHRSGLDHQLFYEAAVLARQRGIPIFDCPFLHEFQETGRSLGEVLAERMAYARRLELDGFIVYEHAVFFKARADGGFEVLRDDIDLAALARSTGWVG